MPDATSEPAEPDRPVDDVRPPALTVAAALVGLQGLGFVGLAALSASDTVADRLEVGLSVAVFLAGYGAVLLAGAWGLATLRSWSRGPVLMTQLVQLGLAWNVRAEPGLAVPLAVSAVVVGVCVLRPSSLEALGVRLEREET
ncbi:hypothetical protein GCM10023340_28760 [Nocardioides marinquilinus]|uniref:Integral membrane protein n=1 Tax=Nocardioides marinquilinus TaxID=1210400 RepID=A0ABP9PSD1_9ACTN